MDLFAPLKKKKLKIQKWLNQDSWGMGWDEGE